MKVELLRVMGEDNDVADAARVSHDKRAEMFSDEKNHGLIGFLSREVHWSPFSHVMARFRVSAPIFTARQLWKSHIGLATQDEPVAWNETSRRYVATDPTFYMPDKWRLAAPSVKQGSSDEEVTHLESIFIGGTKLETPSSLIEEFTISELVQQHNDRSKDLYLSLLDSNVCPEQARMVLPQSMMTEWVWTGSIYAFARICNLRQESHSQKDTKIIADQIDALLYEKFPVAWRKLLEEAKTNVKREEIIRAIIGDDPNDEAWSDKNNLIRILDSLEASGFAVMKKTNHGKFD